MCGSYLSGEDLLLTVGLDWTVAVWTTDGVKAGVFGQWNAWDLSDPSTFMESKPHVVLTLGNDSDTPEPSADGTLEEAPVEEELEIKSPQQSSKSPKSRVYSEASPTEAQMLTPHPPPEMCKPFNKDDLKLPRLPGAISADATSTK